MTQTLLFRDPTPLVDRLGRSFFRELPERPGIYLMRGSSDELLYVGKAKNLRRRLGHYRVANPDRMPRRHLRLLRAVTRIEIQECPDEQAALEQEARLLRTARPRFNRAGIWRGPPQFLAWKWKQTALQLAVTPTPGTDWQVRGPRSGARHERAALVRLLWFALFPAQGISGMPAGWFRGHFGEIVTLNFPDAATEIGDHLEVALSGRTDEFTEWVTNQLPPNLSLFDKMILDADLEFLAERFDHE